MSDDDEKNIAKSGARKTLSLRPGSGGGGARGGSGASTVVVQRKRKKVVTPGEPAGNRDQQAAQKTYPGGLTKQEWETRQKVLEKSKTGGGSSALERLQQAN
ncbi:MAG TPA: hypothetical protein DD656_00115, partial [Alphaproteobacteria bacterium]|nr:hypothetical protein [Alphaproteobacteria bacterium]